MFFFGGGKCPNLGVGNVGILGVVNVLLANNLPPLFDAKTLFSAFLGFYIASMWSPSFKLTWTGDDDTRTSSVEKEMLEKVGGRKQAFVTDLITSGLALNL